MLISTNIGLVLCARALTINIHMPMSQEGHKDQVNDCHRSGARYGGYVHNITGKLKKEYECRGEKYEP